MEDFCADILNQIIGFIDPPDFESWLQISSKIHIKATASTHYAHYKTLKTNVKDVDKIVEADSPWFLRYAIKRSEEEEVHNVFIKRVCRQPKALKCLAYLLKNYRYDTSVQYKMFYNAIMKRVCKEQARLLMSTVWSQSVQETYFLGVEALVTNGPDRSPNEHKKLKILVELAQEYGGDLLWINQRLDRIFVPMSRYGRLNSMKYILSLESVYGPLDLSAPDGMGVKYAAFVGISFPFSTMDIPSSLSWLLDLAADRNLRLPQDLAIPMTRLIDKIADEEIKAKEGIDPSLADGLNICLYETSEIETFRQTLKAKLALLLF